MHSIALPQSPLVELADRNGCLSDSDVAQVRQYITTVKEKRTELSDRVAELKALVKQMEEEQREYDKCEAAHWSFICPSRRCPVEIVALIMAECTALSTSEYAHPSQAPLLFLQVSKLWREIALATPRLWTSITVDVTPAHPKQTLDMLEKWVKRSKDHPLYLELRQSNSQYAGIPPVMEVIMREATRVREMKLKITSELNGYFECVNDEFVNLERIEILSALPIYSDVYHSAPKLREVVTGFPSCNLLLAWSNLTEWTFLKVSVDHCLFLLGLVPSLERYTTNLTSIKDWDHAEPPPRNALIHSNLREFNVTCQNREDLVGFLEPLTLPSLTSFTLTQIQGDKDGLAPEFTSFIMRSGGTLEHLDVSADHLAQSLLATLVYTPNLLKLRATCRALRPSLDDAFLQALAYQKDAHTMVPKLQHLSVRGVFGFKPQTLFDVVASRYRLPSSENLEEPSTDVHEGKRGVSRLRSLEVHIDTPFFGLNPIKYEELKELRDEGLLVSVMCRNHRFW